MKTRLAETDAQGFHREQYKMLREEILAHQREINKTEVSGILMVGATYGWLLINKQSISSHAVWFIAPCLVFLCAIRYVILTVRINQIGEYLRKIEESLIGNESVVPGWERYYAVTGKRSALNGPAIVGICIVGLTLVATLIASWFLSK